MISWTCTFTDNNKKDICSKIFDASGRLVKDMGVSNIARGGNQYNAKIVVGSDNKVGLFWVSDNNTGLYYRAFNQNTHLFSPECKIMDISGDITQFTYSIIFSAGAAIIASTNSNKEARISSYSLLYGNLCELSSSTTYSASLTPPPFTTSNSSSHSYTSIKSESISLSISASGTSSNSVSISSSNTDSHSRTTSVSKTDTTSISSTISNSETDTLSITSTTSNSGSVSNTGTISNTRTDTPSQTKTVSNTDTASISGTISDTKTDTYSSTKTMSDTGTTSNSGTASNTETDSYSLTGTESTSGTASISGTISDTKTDSHSLTDTVSTSSTTSNSGTISNSGTYTYSSSKTMSNSGSVSNSGTASNTKTDSHSLTDTVSTSSTTSNSGTISNSGTDTHSSSKTTSNSGSVSNTGTTSATITGSQSITSTSSTTESASNSLTNSQTESKNTVSATQTHELTQSSSISLGCDEVVREVPSITITYYGTTTFGNPTINKYNNYTLADSSVFRNNNLEAITVQYNHKIVNDAGMQMSNHWDDLRDNKYIKNAKINYPGDCDGIRIPGIARKVVGKTMVSELFKTTKANIDCVEPSITSKNGEITLAPNRGINIKTEATFYEAEVSAMSSLRLSGKNKFGNSLVGDALLSAAYCILKDASPQGPLEVRLLNNDEEVEATVNKKLYYSKMDSVETVFAPTNDQLPATNTRLIYKLSNIRPIYEVEANSMLINTNSTNINIKKYGSMDSVNQDQLQLQVCANVSSFNAHVNAKWVSNVKTLGVDFQYGSYDSRASEFIANFNPKEQSYEGLHTHGLVCYNKELGSTHSAVLVPNQCVNKNVGTEVTTKVFTVEAVGYFSGVTESGIRVCNEELSNLASKTLTRTDLIFKDECTLSFNSTEIMSQDIVGSTATQTADCLVLGV